MALKQPEFHLPKIQSTSDGSSTLIHPVFDELYHSRHGAWTESQHIFVKHGLMPVVEKEPDVISVFEMGFGSGLNAALTREVADQYEIPISYSTVELYPVDFEVIKEMVMPHQLPDERKGWLELHQTNWDEMIQVDSFFSLLKMKKSFPKDTIPGMGKFDLVFYDAFAPAAQPELWNLTALGQCYDLLNEGGMWLSYCAKGQVRRALKEVGFEVEALPGPPGKREMTRASKPRQDHAWQAVGSSHKPL